MAMLYLTPVLPLGPVSYMCGSTSMALSSFVIAKVASLPLMLLYVFIGASAGTLIADTEAIEHNSTLIVSGILLSITMIAGISHYIRKELMTVRSAIADWLLVTAIPHISLVQILERQKQTSENRRDSASSSGGIELGIQSVKPEALQRRHTSQHISASTSSMEDTLDVKDK